MQWSMAACSTAASISSRSRLRSTSLPPKCARSSTSKTRSRSARRRRRAGLARRKDLLQHIALDGLLQDRHAAKSGIDAVGIVAGDEHERHTAFFQDFCDGIDQPVAEIDIE